MIHSLVATSKAKMPFPGSSQARRVDVMVHA